MLTVVTIIINLMFAPSSSDTSFYRQNSTMLPFIGRAIYSHCYGNRRGENYAITDICSVSNEVDEMITAIL